MGIAQRVTFANSDSDCYPISIRYRIHIDLLALRNLLNPVEQLLNHTVFYFVAESHLSPFAGELLYFRLAIRGRYCDSNTFCRFVVF